MQDQGFSRGMVVMVDTTPRTITRKLIKQKLDRNECLLCGAPAHKRGLCKTHYSRYRVVRSEKAASDRVMFDARLIKSGRLLPSRQGQRTDRTNEFRNKGA